MPNRHATLEKMCTEDFVRIYSFLFSATCLVGNLSCRLRTCVKLNKSWISIYVQSAVLFRFYWSFLETMNLSRMKARCLFWKRYLWKIGSLNSDIMHFTKNERWNFWKDFLTFLKIGPRVCSTTLYAHSRVPNLIKDIYHYFGQFLGWYI